mmetsp:Transcript_9517/g.18423  ORF Transcript_9517/g.18423 Transcript_9517/m.18423 type:complete len:1293 (+) Transcript_9517:1205-5083(+)
MPYGGIEYNDALAQAEAAGVAESLSCNYSSSDPIFAVVSESASLILDHARVEDIRMNQSSFVLLSKGAFASLNSTIVHVTFQDAFIFSGYDTDPAAYMEIFIDHSIVRHCNLARSLTYKAPSFSNFIAAGPGTNCTIKDTEFTENFMVENSLLEFAPLIYLEDFYSVTLENVYVARNYLRSGGFLFNQNTLNTDTQLMLNNTEFTSNFMDSKSPSSLVRMEALVKATYTGVLLDCSFNLNHGNYIGSLVLAKFPSLNSPDAVESTVVIKDCVFDSNALGGKSGFTDLAYTEGTLNNLVQGSLFINTTNYEGEWVTEHSLVHDYDMHGMYSLSDTQLNSSMTSREPAPCTSQLFLFEPQNFEVRNSEFVDCLNCSLGIKLNNVKQGDHQVLDTLSFSNMQLCFFIVHGMRFSHISLETIRAQAIDRLLWAFYAVDQNRLGMQLDLDDVQVSGIESKSTTDGLIIFQQGSININNSRFSDVSTHTSLMFIATSSCSIINSTFNGISSDSDEYSPLLEFTSFSKANLTIDRVSINNCTGQGGGLIMIQAKLDQGLIRDSIITSSYSQSGNLIDLELMSGKLSFENCVFYRDGTESNTKSSLIFVDFKNEAASVSLKNSTVAEFRGLAILMMQSQISSASVSTEACKFANNTANVVINRGCTYNQTSCLLVNNTGTSSACYDGTAGSVAYMRDSFLTGNRDTFQGGLITVAGPTDKIFLYGLNITDTHAVSLGGVLYFKDDAEAYVEGVDIWNNTSLVASVLLSNNYKINNVTFENCLISANQGSTLITVYEGHLILKNCTFIRSSVSLIKTSLIYMIKSTFLAEKVQVIGVQSDGLGCFLSSDNSELVISGSMFNGMNCSSSIDILSSSLDISTSEFKNGTQALTAVCNPEFPCPFAISDSTFDDLHSIDKSPPRVMTMRQGRGRFKNVHFSNLSIAGASLTETSASFENCSFSQVRVPLASGSALQLMNSDIVINTTEFVGCEAYQGTVFAQSSSCSVSNSMFDNCEAQKGGAISLQSSDFSFYYCRFSNNQATSSSEGKGGAVFSPNNSTLHFAHSIFDFNSAVLEGGAVYWQDTQPLFEDVAFANNSAKYGPNYATNIVGALAIGNADNSTLSAGKTYAQVVNSEEVHFYNIPSGQIFPGYLQVNMIDIYGQLISTDNSSIATLISEPPLSISGTFSATALGGVLTFKNFTLVAKPTSEQQANLTINSGRVGDVVLKLKLFMRYCSSARHSLCDMRAWLLYSQSELDTLQRVPGSRSLSWRDTDLPRQGILARRHLHRQLLPLLQPRGLQRQ